MQDLESLDVLLTEARNVIEEMRGKRAGGLRITVVEGIVDDVVIVDDGAENWATMLEDYTLACHGVVKAIIDDQFYDESGWYDSLCEKVETIYCSQEGDFEKLCEKVDQCPEFVRIFNELGVECDDLPRTMIALKNNGDRFTGNSAFEMAQAWLEEFDDADDIFPWIEAGFWCPQSAAALEALEITAEEAVEIAEERDSEGETDTIYEFCNNDVNISVFQLTTENQEVE